MQRDPIERGIIFRDWLVERILAGAKTQTRRLVDAEVQKALKFWDGATGDADVALRADGAQPGWYVASRAYPKEGSAFLCPSPYLVGDGLWVREPWRVAAWRDRVRGPDDRRGALDYRASPELTRTPWLHPPEAKFRRLVQQSVVDCRRKGADDDGRGGWEWKRGRSPCRWRSARFMPRWASRLGLRVGALRLEPLQAITAADIRAEGLTCPDHDFASGLCVGECPALREAWVSGWDEINGHRPGAKWSEQPWVLATTFRLETNLAQLARAA